jgi:hypothetical protein
MILAGKNTEFSKEQLKTIRNGKLNNDAAVKVTVEEFNKEVKRLFTEEKEAMDELVELSAK